MDRRRQPESLLPHCEEKFPATVQNHFFSWPIRLSSGSTYYSTNLEACFIFVPRRFFQSLGSSSSSRLTVQTSCQSPAHNRQLSSGEEETETGKGGNRKEFFKVLRGEKHTCHAEKQVSEEDQKQDDGIRFTLRFLAGLQSLHGWTCWTGAIWPPK